MERKIRKLTAYSATTSALGAQDILGMCVDKSFSTHFDNLLTAERGKKNCSDYDEEKVLSEPEIDAVY